MVPKYLAQDITQEAIITGSSLRDTAPSLYVGPKGMKTGLKVTRKGMHHAFYLLEGKREWRVFQSKDTPYLYARPDRRTYHVDPFQTDLERYPLMTQSTMFVGEQVVGELLIVPAGCLRAEKNIEASIGLGMNYVDDHNYYSYLWETLLSGDYHAFAATVGAGLGPGSSYASKGKAHDLAWGEFKRRSGEGR